MLEARRAILQAQPAGSTLEQILVLETNGPVKELYETISVTPGLDWLADEDLRDIPPDEDYFVRAHPDQPLTAQLYLVAFNQQALEQLLALWRMWSAGQRLPVAHRRWREVFAQLRDIRRWSVRDRLQETGVLEYWRSRVESGFETVIVEIELWFRQTVERTRSELRVTEAVSRAQGQVVATCTIEEIAFHALTCRLPISAVESMLNDPEVELLQCDEVRLVRPTAQISVASSSDDVDDDVGATIAERLGDPVVGLLDGLPLENHSRLAGRLVVDDPDRWSETYPVSSRSHGTAMASLILHGDLSANEAACGRRLYVRPILRPNAFGQERAPDEQSWIDLIHRAVRRIVVGEGDEPPVAPSVCVINLSIGDSFQPFVRSVSPLARLLDWLAARHKILFVVSAGNHNAPLHVAEPLTGEAIVTAIASAQRHRRILAPAEAMNALTVGATSKDGSGPWAPTRPSETDLPLPDGLPCAVSGLGRGYRRMVKPDVLAPGGRVVFERGLDADPPGYAPKPGQRVPPGHRVAAPGVTAGSSGVRYAAGTSNAAALVSRAATQIFEAVESLRSEPNASELARVPMALWIRTLLAHGSAWSSESSRLVEQVLRNEGNRHTFTDDVSALLGFGRIESDRVLACTAERVTVLIAGQLAAGEQALHQLPVPQSLNAHTAWRRLTITMSWFSPINPIHRKYRRAALFFEPPGQSELLVRRRGVHWQAVRRGTLQHEVLEANAGAINVGDRDILTVPVACTADAGSLDESVPYALAVSLEVAPGLNTRIYDEVRERITPRVPLRPATS